MLYKKLLTFSVTSLVLSGCFGSSNEPGSGNGDKYVNACGRSLDQAIQLGMIGVVKCMIKEGVNLNARNSQGDLPIHIATQWGDVGLVKLMLENGADSNMRDSLGKTPLQTAIFWKRKEVEALLREHGAR